MKDFDSAVKDQMATPGGRVDVNKILASLVDRGDAVLAFDWISHEAGMTKEVYDLQHPGFQPPRDFIARSLHCAYGTMDPDDREAFRESYVIEFHIMQKVMFRSPLAAIPERGVLFPKDDTCEVPQPGYLTMARYIAPCMPFRIRLVGTPVPVVRLRFLPFLNGLMDRAVQ